MKVTSHSGTLAVYLDQHGAELRRGDLIALIVSALLALIICYLLVSDQYFFSRAYLPEPTTPLAEVVNPDRGVKHRSANVPLWRRTVSHQFLGEQDQVFTGAESRAEIRFQESDAVLQLEPNSLVVIRGEHKQAESNWFRLGLKTRSASAGTVVEVNGNAAIIAPGSRVQVARSSEGKADIKVLAGSVTLARMGQAPVSIQANESATVASNSEAAAVVKPLPLTLLSPSFGEKIFAKDALSPIKLSWSSPTTEPGEFLVEVSGQGENEYKSKSWTTAASFFEFTPTKVGDYHWQVSRKNQPDTAVSGRFTVVPLTPPRLRFPAPDLTIEQIVSQESPILFRWQASGADRYILQVSTLPDFSNLRTEAYVEGTSQASGSLAASLWHWRVGGEIDGSIIWSEPQRFIIRLPSELKAPRPADAVVTADRQVKLSWQGRSSEASGYQIMVGQDKNFTRGHTLLAASAPITWTPPNPGTYYWQVRALTLHNTFSPPSERMQFEILPPPLSTATSSSAIESTARPADASSTDRPPQAEVVAAILKASPTGKTEPSAIPVAQPKVAAREPTSSYLIRLISPNLIAYADPARTGVSLELAWEGVGKNTSYIVQLSADKNFNEIKSEWTTTKPSAVLSSLDQTSYWRVKGAGSEAAWSDIGKLELLAESPIRISSVTTTGTEPGVKLSWRATRFANGEIIVRQSGSDRVVLSQPVSGPEGKLNLTTLPPGAYDWHIRSLSSQRRVASRVDHFSIAKQSNPPSSSAPGQWRLQAAPYASAFDYRSHDARSQDYSSTDFSAGGLFEVAFSKSNVQGFLQYQLDYSEYFLIEEDQEPETVINQGFALGGGYQFAASAWWLVPRLFFLNQDFVRVTARNDQLDAETTSADWLAASFNASYSWSYLMTGIELLRSVVLLNEGDFLTSAEVTQLKGYVQHGIGSDDALSAIYGISFRSLRATFSADDGYIESDATSASVGLNLLL